MKNPYFLLAWLLNVIGLGLMISFMFDPLPWMRTLSVIMPWFALGVMFLARGRLVVSASRSVGQPTIVFAICLPLIAFAAWAFVDFKLLDWPFALAAGFGIALLLVLAFVVAGSANRHEGFAFVAALLAVLGSGYGYGVVGFLDMTGDTQIVQSYWPQVLRKHVQTGRRTTDYLTLAAWGSEPQREMSVDDNLYEEAVLGQPVCIDVHPGRLKIRWYDIHACTTAPGA